MQRRLERGERVTRWKLGYTSLAMRAQMGIDSPDFGPFTDVMILGSGTVPRHALQPRVEPEIALTLARPVPPGADVDEVLACCSSSRTALEVVDSVWTGYRFRLEDITADGSSAGWVVLGEEIGLDDLAATTVELRVDDLVVGRASGAAAAGHPARGVAWLADHLHADDRGLRAGDIVITGGLTAAVPLLAGAIVAATLTAAVPLLAGAIVAATLTGGGQQVVVSCQSAASEPDEPR